MSEPAVFRAVLTPHRSSTLKGVRIVVLILAGAAGVVGAGFAFFGAWPVSGFFGLEMGLLCAALRIHHRRGRAYESIDLTASELKVRRVDARGEQQEFSFQPYWLRVVIAESASADGRLELRSHGRAVAVGSFLSPAERRDLARALEDALAGLRLPAPAVAR